MVAVERGVSTVAPEILDSGALIARRITSISQPDEDPGAMFIRGVLHRVYEEVGDGTATTAVLFASVLAEGRKAVAAGVPVQPLRSHLERLGNDVFRALMGQSRPVTNRDVLTRVASSACHDAELADLLGESMDVVGAYGQVDLRPSHLRESWQEFVRGSFWESGLLSTPDFRDPVAQRTEMNDAAILLTNLALEDQNDAIRILTAVRGADASGLIILARSVSTEVKALLHANSNRHTFPIVVVKAPAHMEQEALTDLAVMTGGQMFLSGAGDTLDRVATGSFGHARTAWATSRQFGLINGQGSAQSIRTHVTALTNAYRRSSRQETRTNLGERLGRFQGVSATIWIGASTDTESKHRHQVAERGIRVLRHALHDGVLPGGGAAFLHCSDRLERQMDLSTDECERFALRIVLQALRAPATMILANAGHQSALALDSMRQSGSPYGFDVLKGAQSDMHEAGIVDSARVMATAARGAIRSAALALSIDVVIHSHATEISVNPE
jgi:chaperonin GroEL